MLTNEEFMNPLKKVLNEFKIRASWGELGDLSAASQYYANNEQYYFQSGYQYPGTPMNFGDRTIYGLNPTLNPNPGSGPRHVSSDKIVDFSYFILMIQ